jgi:hypothetical protein
MPISRMTVPIPGLAVRSLFCQYCVMLRGFGLELKGVSRTLAAFALLAVMVRALIPVGYMVTPADLAGSTSVIMLCTAQGYVARSVDLSTGKLVSTSKSSDSHRDAPAQKPADHSPCVFAAASAIPAPESSPAIQLPTPAVSQTWADTSALAPGRGLAAPPPWPTGPPATL